MVLLIWCVRARGRHDQRNGRLPLHVVWGNWGGVVLFSFNALGAKTWCQRSAMVLCIYTSFVLPCSFLGVARIVYVHRIWPYIWWYPCQKHRIYTVYTYVCMVLVNPVHFMRRHGKLHEQSRDGSYGLLRRPIRINMPLIRHAYNTQTYFCYFGGYPGLAPTPPNHHRIVPPASRTL